MEHYSSHLLEGKADSRDCVRVLIGTAQHSIYLIGQNLEPELYNDKEIYDYLALLATTNRKTEIRIIAHDTRVALNQGHYLIHLAQKLPSYVQIRTTVTQLHRRFSENWLIVDREAFMRLRIPARFEGYVETENKLECKTYTDKFLEIWEACEPDQNSRRLSL